MSVDLPPAALTLVRVEAHRIARLLPTGALELDDLIGYGHVGLVEAQSRYDPSRGIDFEIYARHRIRGAIYDGIRQSLGPLKLRTYERLRRQILAWRLAGEPTPPPSTATRRAATAEVSWTAIADLATALVAAQAEARPGPVDPETQFLDAERLDATRAAMARLEPEQQEILRAVYDLDEIGDSGAKLAERRGLHRSGISRRHQAILERMRRWLKARPP